MHHSLRIGSSFGMTSGIITTLGVITGLAAGTQSRLAVIGSIFTIAIADGLSDACGIHISEESENVHTPREIWMATSATFFSKLIIALSFLIPVLIFDLSLAILISVCWGSILIVLVSIYIARINQKPVIKPVIEHLFIALGVVIIAHYVGIWTSLTFG